MVQNAVNCPLLAGVVGLKLVTDRDVQEGSGA